jgi:hypothetical protein
MPKEISSRPMTTRSLSNGSRLNHSLNHHFRLSTIHWQSNGSRNQSCLSAFGSAASASEEWHLNLCSSYYVLAAAGPLEQDETRSSLASLAEEWHLNLCPSYCVL